MHNHWDLENHRSDWDDIWHELLEWVGGDAYIIKCEIAVFAYLPIFFYLSVTTGKIGIKFGMHS